MTGPGICSACPIGSPITSAAALGELRALLVSARSGSLDASAAEYCSHFSRANLGYETFKSETLHFAGSGTPEVLINYLHFMNSSASGSMAMGYV